MKIGVVGAGVVGRATARCWLEHAQEVRVFDVLSERRTHARYEVFRSDVIFVCVPADAVDAVFGGILPDDRDANFVLCSTVPIGTTRKLREKYILPNLVHSPCFVTARCAVVDAQTPARNVIGGPPCAGSDALRSLYVRRFPGVPIHAVTSDESEALKLIQNSFFALKISFFNEVHALCTSLGLGWEAIHEALLADGRVHPSHTKIPGHDGFGFGGACLPNDIAEFVRAVESEGLSAAVSRAAMERNLEDRKRKI